VLHVFADIRITHTTDTINFSKDTLMANINIQNAAPMMIARGVQDLSGRPLPLDGDTIATHIPVVYGFAQKGPKRALVSGAARTNIFGSDTFDLRKKFATHQTALSNLISEGGGTQMFERLEPVDIGPRANFTLWADVLETTIPQYERDDEGAFVLDPLTSERVPLAGNVTLNGTKIKWVMSSVNALEDEADFGTLTVKAGDQVSGAVHSKRYPIMQFWASSRGSVFNNSGARLWASTENAVVPLNTNLMDAIKAYPFRLQLVQRSSEYDTARPVETQFGEQFIDFTFKPDTIDPTNDSRVSIQETFLHHYTNTSNNGSPVDYGHFGGAKVYDENVAKLVDMIYANELGQGQNSDFTGATDEQWLVNFISCISSKGEPYYTAEIVGGAGSVRLTETTNLFAAGGSDGTMVEVGATTKEVGGLTVDMTAAEIEQAHFASFAGMVEKAISEYANPNSVLMDTADNVESIFYDSGFPLRTKNELPKFISERKDLFVVLSTYDVNGGPMTAEQEYSTAVALRGKLKAYAESDYFGTPTMRGMVVGRYGRMIGSQYKKKLPLTLEVANKANLMMGASDGKWREGKVFDANPGNIITLFEDVNVTFTPARVRNRDWVVGLNWVQKLNSKQLFFPALQTIYDDDTSILNSFFVAMCCVELQKVGERVWRQFTGTVRLTNEQLVDRVNAAVQEKTLGRFCDMFKIVPDAKVTAADEQRNYSWHLGIELYANGMKTVMTLDVRARRMSDLA
jgi:hypothetical protein